MVEKWCPCSINPIRRGGINALKCGWGSSSWSELMCRLAVAFSCSRVTTLQQGPASKGWKVRLVVAVGNCNSHSGNGHWSLPNECRILGSVDGLLTSMECHTPGQTSTHYLFSFVSTPIVVLSQIRQKYDSQEDVLNCWPYHQCIINQSRMSRSGLDKISNGTNDMMGRNFFAWDHSRYQSKHTYISLHRYAVN